MDDTSTLPTSAEEIPAEESAPVARGRPFAPGQSGNPNGRPKGARNKATIAAEALLDGDAEAITRKIVEKALDGDMIALRLCLACGFRRSRPGITG